MNKNVFTQKKWYIVLIIASLIGVFITIILRMITPKTMIVPQTEFIQVNKTGDKTDFNNIKFTGDIPTLKDRLRLVKIQPSNTTVDYLRKRFIENHQLVPVSGIEDLWKGPEYTLSYNEQDDSYLFYYNFIPKDKVMTDKNKAIKVAEDYVNEVFSQLPLKIQKDNIVKLSGLEEMIEVSYESFGLLEVPFTYSIEDIPLLVEHESEPLLKVLVNSDYKIQKIVFQTDFFYPLPAEQTFKLINLSEAIENINNKKYGSIVSAYETKTGVFSLDTIVDGELNKVVLEYRADLENAVAYPFYHFYGELINEENKIIQAEIITPAVKIAE